MDGRPRRSTAGRVAFWGAAVVLAVLATELSRYDHGFAEPFFWVAFVAAPLTLIFGAAAAGARRWYGWPDLGPGPGRAAVLATAVVGGALLGNSLVPDDVEETRARGLRLARQIREWKDSEGRGSWPARLEDIAAYDRRQRDDRGAEPVPHRTRLGSLFPPAFDYDPRAATLSFRVGRRTEVLDVAAEGASWRAR